MNKIFLLLMSSIFLMPLISCSNEEINKVPIFTNTFSVSSLNDQERYYCNQLSLDDLNQMIDTKCDFCLYVYLPGCGTCELFPITLDNYLKETNAVINYCLLNTFSQLEESPKLTNSSFVFYNDGKIAKVENLDNYALEPDKFETMMNDNTYMTNIQILNPTYMESYDSLFYPSYKFCSFCDEIPEKGYYFSHVNEALNSTSNILLINENEILNTDEIIDNIESLEIDYLGFIGKDNSKNTAGLKKLFGCEEFGVVTYLQYQNGQLFNHQLFASLAN